MSSSGGKRRRRRSSRARKVDSGDFSRPRFAAPVVREPAGAGGLPGEGGQPVPTSAAHERSRALRGGEEAAMEARLAAEKVAFDRSNMTELPNLKERPPSEEARERHRERKARERRNKTVKTVVLPLTGLLAVILVLAISWHSYSQREEEIVASEEGKSEGRGYHYSEVSAQDDEAWREKREQLLLESRGSEEDREALDREVERRKRELLGKEEPLSDVLRKENQYLPDRDD
ncbi:MAG: hypothetical protein AAGD22_10600 [Verrucomicrobiota bacterium]